MPTAICNKCLSIIHWKKGQINLQKCTCGSSDLTTVSVRIHNNEYIYHDRMGNERKRLPVTEFIPKDD